MQRVDLKKVLEMLVNEEQGNAENLLHQWFVEKTKSIHESLMQEDDDVLDEDATKDIEDDQESIEGEEYCGGSDLKEDDDDDHHIASLAATDVQDDDDFDVSDFDNSDNEDSEEGSDDLEGSTESSEEPSVENLADEVKDLQSELERLKSEFAKIQGDEGSEEAENDEDENPDAEADEVGDHEEPDGDEDEDGNEPGEEDSDEDEVEESFDFLDLEEAKKGKMPPWLKKGKKDKKDDDDDEEDDKKSSKKSPKKGVQPPWLKKKKVKESDDLDFLDLEEDYKLENVSTAGLSGTKEIGSGGSLKVNNDSPIPQRKPDQRVGGSAVQIKSGSTPKGYDRETPPKVAAPLVKSPKNEKQDLKAVPKDGNSSATLNKKGDGFGSDSPKSPIGAGATDLRGSTLKRK
jgi:hypothetical protein